MRSSSTIPLIINEYRSRKTNFMSLNCISLCCNDSLMKVKRTLVKCNKVQNRINGNFLIEIKRKLKIIIQEKIVNVLQDNAFQTYFKYN